MRARTVIGDETFHVATFGSIDAAGLLTDTHRGVDRGGRTASRERNDMTETHHAISYVEISVTDMARARSFYGGAFGWGFNDYGPDYAGIRAPDGDGEVGGLGVGRPSGPGGVLALLYSDDLDATLSAVEGAGGKVTEAPYEYPGGRRFLFSDPDGNVLGVFQLSALARAATPRVTRRPPGHGVRPGPGVRSRPGAGPPRAR